MFVNNISGNNKIDQTRKKKNVDNNSTSEIFSLDEPVQIEPQAQTQDAQNIVNIQSVLSIDSLNLLNGVMDKKYSSKLNLDWGFDVLKYLDQIKHQILNGKVSYSSLLSIRDRLNNIPIDPSDQRLAEIIEQIKTRAEVEVEKIKKFTETVKLFDDETVSGDLNG